MANVDSVAKPGVFETSGLPIVRRQHRDNQNKKTMGIWANRGGALNTELIEMLEVFLLKTIAFAIRSVDRWVSLHPPSFSRN